MLFHAKNLATRKSFFLMLPIILILAFYPIAQASTAAVTQMIKSAPANSNPQSQIPPNLSPEQIDAHLATMDDVQVRQELAQKLKQEASLKARATASNKPIDVFHRLADGAAAVLNKIGAIFLEAAKRPDQWDAAVKKLSDGKGTSHLATILFATALIITCGLIVKMLFVRATRDIRKHLLQTFHLGRMEFFGNVLSRMLLNAAGLAIYIFVTLVLFVLFYRKGEPGYLIASVYIVVSYYVLLFAFAATTIFRAGSRRTAPVPAARKGCRFSASLDCGYIHCCRSGDGNGCYPVTSRNQQTGLSVDIQLGRSACHFGPDDHDLAKPAAGGRRVVGRQG